MRLFFAVNFSAAVRDRIQGAIDAVGIERPSWRWVVRENLHITLRFLGELDGGDMAALCECAETVTRGFAPFELKIGGLGGFPNLDRARVLFYRVDAGGDSLIALAETLERALVSELSIPEERRPFQPHLTVARIKFPPAREAVERLRHAPVPQAASESVRVLSLMRSTLHRQGARYQCLKEFALSKSK